MSTESSQAAAKALSLRADFTEQAQAFVGSLLDQMAGQVCIDDTGHLQRCEDGGGLTPLSALQEEQDA